MNTINEKPQRAPVTSGKFRSRAEELLRSADIEIDGSRPWDIRVHDPRLYARTFAEGSMGLGEAYMDGWWDCARLDEFFTRLLGARIDARVLTWKDGLRSLEARLFNQQSRSRSFEIGRRHYDNGNRLYERMLDKHMMYSCGYWKDAQTLDEAQEAKLDLICRKLDLKPGMRLLDIGCGWGGMVKFAAERYGVEAVGVTVSEQQANYARESCRDLPIDIRLEDYRNIEGRFDRIVSIGMFEHVGYKNYRTYMETARRLLADDDGLFLLHCIGTNTSVNKTDPWIARYIFPNSMLPSARQITTAIEGLFIFEDWHNFGPDYDPTLMQWLHNFRVHWNELKNDYDNRFYRMWTYYLQASAGTFRCRRSQLWQVLLSPRGVRGGCRVPR
ncbi:MAG TPA: cyclopropane fatty acyl phospholipid synthase [Gammaproteobacteria bacterium]|jgi:cyclopropane-fatty-acyl-phospholipid synthase|nr:cyclopropane fatty acyl phospholipid synthase [Gammaproteobacteria bacterium]